MLVAARLAYAGSRGRCHHHCCCGRLIVRGWQRIVPQAILEQKASLLSSYVISSWESTSAQAVPTGGERNSLPSSLIPLQCCHGRNSNIKASIGARQPPESAIPTLLGRWKSMNPIPFNFNVHAASANVKHNLTRLLYSTTTNKCIKIQRQNGAPGRPSDPRLDASLGAPPAIANNSQQHIVSGLFSISDLQQPRDFIRVAALAIHTCDDIRRNIATVLAEAAAIATAAGTTQSSSQLENTPVICHESVTKPPITVSNAQQAQLLLRLLDSVSQAVCNVIDAAELARSTHAVRAWRDAAQDAFEVLSDKIATLNGDLVLYHATIAVTQAQPDIWNALSEEEQRFAVLLQAEFERDGIHLPEAQREQVRMLQSQITQLESLFSRNLTSCSINMTSTASTIPQHYFWTSQRQVETVLPREVWQQFQVQPAPNDSTASMLAESNDDLICLLRDTQLLQTLLKHSAVPELRRQVYFELMTLVPENLVVLDRLRQARHALAEALGFDSYAERFLQDQMAQRPQHVHDFLQQCMSEIQPAYQQDLKLLKATKQQVESSKLDEGKLEPWDLPFYVSIIKASNGLDTQALSKYFTLDHTLDSMKLLVERVFGIHIEEQPMARSERWDLDESSCTDDHDNDANACRIRRFFFTGPDQCPLGTMYLDLHPRAGKYGHAAHFTVRCGCMVHPTNIVMSSAVDKNGDDLPGRDSGLDLTSTLLDTTPYQLPIVALVCNLSPSGKHGNLTHSEVETLFHEFGHALHSLLSRTKFQHMSGTRGAMDFVETPSHLMENYVWDETFLQMLSMHSETGAALPIHMIQSLRKSRHQLRSIEQMNQILYAMFDQALFGRPKTMDPDSADGRPSTTDMFAALHRKYGVPYAVGTHWHSRFGHLVTYGAGYYSYLYAQVFAADIWMECFEGGRCLDRQAGEKLWHKMLIHGGAKEPISMLSDLLGRPPQVHF